MAAAPEAKAIMRADNRRLKSDLGKSRRLFRRTFGKIGKGISGMFSGLGGIGAGIGVAAIGKDVLDFEKTLTRLGIQAGTGAEDLDKFRQSTIALSKQTGISRSELIGATESLVNLTGRAGFSADKLAVLAEANQATGASMRDLAGLAFSLEKSMKLKSPEELKQGLSSIIQAGKDGAIPLNEMASVMQGVTASFAELGGTGPGSAADLASSLQVLRGAGFKGASEAGTGLESMITALTKKSSQLRKKGIKVFDKSGAFRGIRAILDDFERADLTIKELTDTLGKVEARKAVQGLLKGRQEFEKLSAAARESKAVEEDAAKFRQSSAFKLQASMNRLKETFAAVFTPERIEKFVKAMGKLADLAAVLVDNAKTFALVWGTIKIASFASSMAGIAASAGTAATNATSFAGALGKAGNVLAALGGGFAVGTALDQALGLSDKISDSAFGTQDFEGNRSLRDRGTRLQQQADLASLSGFGFSSFGDMLNPQQTLGDATAVLRQAQGAGVFNPLTGEAQPLAAARVTSKDPLNVAQEALAERGIGLTGEAETLLRAVETANRLVNEAENQRAKGFDVRVIIDDQGRISAVGGERTQAEE